MSELHKAVENAAYKDAYGIAVVGAVNPAAVAASIARHAGVIQAQAGTNAARNHPAIQAMAGHFAYLCGQATGPTAEVLTRVELYCRLENLVTR